MAHLAELVFFPVTQDADIFIRADLLDVSAHDDIAEFFVQFDGAADTVGLFTGDEGRAGTAEGVQHHRIAHGRIHNGVGQQRDGLHGGMVAILLGFIELPNGGFFPSCVPLVLAFLLPAVQHRLVLPLVIWKSPQTVRMRYRLMRDS